MTKVWTVKRLIAAAEDSVNCEVRPVSLMSNMPCNINRVTWTRKGAMKRREGVTIWEDGTIHRNDVEPHLCTKMRPQDAARVLKLEQ